MEVSKWIEGLSAKDFMDLITNVYELNQLKDMTAKELIATTFIIHTKPYDPYEDYETEVYNEEND